MTAPDTTALLVGVDDETKASLEAVLGAQGIRAESVETSSDLGGRLDRSLVDVVVAGVGADHRLDETVSKVASRSGVPVVALVSRDDVDEAVDVLRSGAEELLTTPIDGDEAGYVFEKVFTQSQRLAEKAPGSRMAEGSILGTSAPMKKVADAIRQAAPGETTVLIRGESGTGKELAARSIHEQSARSDGPFVKVHCAALPENLLESELFGYEKGAFTGATARKPGRVDLARGGTLFLDEIGDVSLATQVKLLRLLQDREYERLGGTKTQKADVRFVAATHRDLDKMIEDGSFREDLFYRLNVVTIWLPPLRARRDDIRLLAEHFCGTFAEANNKRDVQLGSDALDALVNQRWPGNVRQLQNCIERLVVFAESDAIEKDAVEREITPSTPFSTQSAHVGVATAGISESSGPSAVVPLAEQLQEAERKALKHALKKARGNKSLAARLLGISRRTLYTKLDGYGIS